MTRSYTPIYKNGFVSEFSDGTAGLFENFSVPTPSKYLLYTVKEEENFLSISNKFFKDTRLWYILAEINFEIDVFNPPAGSQIKIPQ